MVWALAHMRRRPDKEWTAEFLKVCESTCAA